MLGQNHSEILHCIENNCKNDNFKFYIREGIEYFKEGEEDLTKELKKVIGDCTITVNIKEKTILIKKS